MANNRFSRYARLLLGSAFLMIGPEAFAADISPIIGFWSAAKEKCSGTDDYWDIKTSGASATEELCTLVSSTRKGDRFSLRQNCAIEGTENARTDTFTLLKSGQLQVGKRRYKRCPGYAGDVP